MGRSTKRQRPQRVDHISDDEDDEEIDEDGAFDSEDDRKYGAFFEPITSDGSTDDGSSDDGSSGDNTSAAESDEGEGDGGQYMLDLLNNLDNDEAQKPAALAKDGSTMHLPESEFTASSSNNSSKLTLDALLDGLQDTKGFSRVQKVIPVGSAVSAPVANVVANRAQRQVHYQRAKKDGSGWNAAVQEIQMAETLDFRPKQRLEMTREIMLDKFVPTTEFEKQIHAALHKEDENNLDKEDDLGSAELTLEQYKARHGQLAKMRALMFYHEQKRHKINKIKSKTYRRIRKKQRQRAAEAELDENPELEAQLKEKEEIERMKERASLAHKNTSKWAKRILKRGAHVDKDTRRALSAQLQKGEDLRKRMTATAGSDDDSDEDLIDTARKVLQDAEQGTDNLQSHGLFKLSFMQKGVERQRERAKQEARQLLAELEDSTTDGESEDNRETKPHNRTKAVSKSELKAVLNDGDLVASSLKHGATTATVSSDVIQVDGFHTSTHTLDTPPPKEPSDENNMKKRTASMTPNLSKPTIPGELSNPWLNCVDTPAAAPKKLRTGFKRSGFVDVDRAVNLLDNTSPKEENVLVQRGTDIEPQISMLSQEDLVRKAFATTSQRDADNEFAKEKANVEQREDPTTKQKKQEKLEPSSGWGSWAGTGAPPPMLPRKLPKKLQPPVKVPVRKRLDAKRPNVIISEKRVKKTADQFMLSHIPYPFTTREEYERSLAGGIGREWNVTSSFKDMTRPEILTRAGKIIQPLSNKAKKSRAPAKF